MSIERCDTAAYRGKQYTGISYTEVSVPCLFHCMHPFAQLSHLHCMQSSCTAATPRPPPGRRYLKRVRLASGVQDERELRSGLMEIVRSDRGKLQGCFLCDQLVFQEMMTQEGLMAR